VFKPITQEVKMYEQFIKIFFEIDEFYKHFEDSFHSHLLHKNKNPLKRVSELSLSEIMTIIILFHTGGFRNFKHLYKGYVQVHLTNDFPQLVSYNRFVELMGRTLIPLIAFQIHKQKGIVTGISFIDSTALAVCRNQKIHKHRVFKGIAGRGKTSMGWFYGFKLHLIVNDSGEIVSWALTPGNSSDNDISTCLKSGKNVWGKLFADKGYISQ